VELYVCSLYTLSRRGQRPFTNNLIAIEGPGDIKSSAVCIHVYTVYMCVKQRDYLLDMRRCVKFMLQK
jgi:hypothetical protein